MDTRTSPPWSSAGCARVRLILHPKWKVIQNVIDPPASCGPQYSVIKQCWVFIWGISDEQHLYITSCPANKPYWRAALTGWVNHILYGLPFGVEDQGVHRNEHACANGGRTL